MLACRGGAGETGGAWAGGGDREVARVLLRARVLLAVRTNARTSCRRVILVIICRRFCGILRLPRALVTKLGARKVRPDLPLANHPSGDGCHRSRRMCDARCWGNLPGPAPFPRSIGVCARKYEKPVPERRGHLESRCPLRSPFSIITCYQ